MNTHIFPICFGLTGCLLIGGCSTPQAALDQANHTAALTVVFDNEMNAYRAAAARVAGARVQSIRRQEVAMAAFDEVQAFNDRTAALAGMNETLALRQTLVELTDSRSQDQAATRQRLAELDAALASIVLPLPGQTEKLRAVQQALAALGTELSSGERLRIVTEAVTTVRDEIKKNKEAAKSAIDNAGTAPVPQPPAGDQP